MKSDEKLVIQIEKNETLGDFIQKCRQQYGWTQEELGWRTGITREQVGRACRELELALAANLTKSNLRKASNAISTIAKMLNDTEMFSNKK